MANNPPGTQGAPATGNQDISDDEIGSQDISDDEIGDEDISDDENVINNILRDLLIYNFWQLQRTVANNNFNATSTGQNPASSHLQAPVSNEYLASTRESIQNRLDELRETAFSNLWHDVPPTVHTQILFHMKLIDTNPRFIIPVQMAMRFFPSPVAHYYEYLTVTGQDRLQWQMKYAYNSGTLNFEIISQWDTFLEHYSILIGDHVSFLLDRRGDIFVITTKRRD